MVYPPHNPHFLQVAEALTPKLSVTRPAPLGTITVKADSSALLGWAATPVGPVLEMKPLGKGESIILDFGGPT